MLKLTFVTVLLRDFVKAWTTSVRFSVSSLATAFVSDELVEEAEVELCDLSPAALFPCSEGCVALDFCSVEVELSDAAWPERCPGCCFSEDILFFCCESLFC